MGSRCLSLEHLVDVLAEGLQDTREARQILGILCADKLGQLFQHFEHHGELGELGAALSGPRPSSWCRHR